MRDQFPAIVPRSEESREVLDLLNYRQSLVRKRTSVANQLHAFARAKGFSKFRLPAVKARKKLMEAPGTETEQLLLSSRLVLFDELTRQIKALEDKLEEEADKEERIQLIRTHPGVVPLTSLALIHTLGDVRRFRRKEEVVAFVGLDPLEKSSGETKRMVRSANAAHGSCAICSVWPPRLVVTRRSDTATSCFVMASVMRNSRRVGRSWLVRGVRRARRKRRSL